MCSGSWAMCQARTRVRCALQEQEKHTGLCLFSLISLANLPCFALHLGGRLRLPPTMKGKVSPRTSAKSGRGDLAPCWLPPQMDGPTVGHGDRWTTPLRQVHAVQPRRLWVLSPSQQLGVSPVGLPAPRPSPGNIILAALPGPHAISSRTATGHTSGASSSTPRASATHELPGWRKFQSHTAPLPPCFKAHALRWRSVPSPARRLPFPCAWPVIPPAPRYGYQWPGLSESRGGHWGIHSEAGNVLALSMSPPRFRKSEAMD